MGAAPNERQVSTQLPGRRPEVGRSVAHHVEQALDLFVEQPAERLGGQLVHRRHVPQRQQVHHGADPPVVPANPIQDGVHLSWSDRSAV